MPGWRTPILSAFKTMARGPRKQLVKNLPSLARLSRDAAGRPELPPDIHSTQPPHFARPRWRRVPGQRGTSVARREALSTVTVNASSTSRPSNPSTPRGERVDDHGHRPDLGPRHVQPRDGHQHGLSLAGHAADLHGRAAGGVEAGPRHGSGRDQRTVGPGVEQQAQRHPVQRGVHDQRPARVRHHHAGGGGGRDHHRARRWCVDLAHGAAKRGRDRSRVGRVVDGALGVGPP